MHTGLTQKEATAKLKADGYNELPSAKPKGLINFAVEIIREPMISLLILAGILYLLLGDTLEASLLMLSIFGVIGISLYQERKSEQSLAALTRLSSPQAVVIRDGIEKRIPSREVVVGDLAILTEGDRVPADVELIEAVNLSTDESMLTGESQPATKDIVKENQAFLGTLVVAGHGIGKVRAIGLETELGKIGKSLKTIEMERTLLQREISTFVQWLALIGIVLCTILAVIYIITEGRILEGILAGLTLAIGVLPEEFPIVLLLFLTMGAYRLAKRNVLTRRTATIETLGAATVLCVDKTGTITENMMAISAIYLASGKKLINDLSLDDEVIKYGILASQRKPFDPTETAFINEGNKLFDVSAFQHKYTLIKEYPLNTEFLCVAHAYRTKDEDYLIALKGAPEAVVDLCHLPTTKATEVLKEAEKLAKEGLRVIAVARGRHSGENLPEDRHGVRFEFLGLAALSDPVRHGVAKSVDDAYRAGIRIIMITGDHKETALNIAQQIGLETKGVISGEEFEAMSNAEKTEALSAINVFTRVMPHQKLEIIRELKHRGEVVAMTGDGVNDAPALKAAHIGIAMGMRGTDVAREAASIVLLDDNFNSIVRGVRIGRRIYGNLQKAINYLISIHIPIIILSIAPVLLRLPLLLMPIHIVFLEFMIDPISTIVFEADREERNIMDQPPRKLANRIVAIRNLSGSIIYGLLIGLILIMSYSYFLPLHGEQVARTLTFVLLTLLNLVLVIVNLSKKNLFQIKTAITDNLAFIVVTTFALAIICLATNIEFLQGVFDFKSLHVTQWGYLLAVTIIFFLATELIKAGYRMFTR